MQPKRRFTFVLWLAAMLTPSIALADGIDGWIAERLADEILAGVPAATERPRIAVRPFAADESPIAPGAAKALNASLLSALIARSGGRHVFVARGALKSLVRDVSDLARPGPRDPDISTSGNPPINNKSVTSQVAVQSGQTVFLGGLISEQDSRGRTGVPYLSRIPFIGPLFGSKTKASTRSETLVMITPTVVETSADLKEISIDMEKEFSRVPPLKISRLNKTAEMQTAANNQPAEVGNEQ